LSKRRSLVVSWKRDREGGKLNLLSIAGQGMAHSKKSIRDVSARRPSSDVRLHRQAGEQTSG
jgi:hypothetical protein